MTLQPTDDERLALRQLRELTQTQKTVLGAAYTNDLGWAQGPRYSKSYRLWVTPHTHRLVTPTAKRLVELKLLTHRQAPHTSTKGAVEPTRLGRLYIEQRSHLQPSTKEAHNRYGDQDCPGCTRRIHKWDLIRKTVLGWCCAACTLRPPCEEDRVRP